jgi:hypothetical protein
MHENACAGFQTIECKDNLFYLKRETLPLEYVLTVAAREMRLALAVRLQINWECQFLLFVGTYQTHLDL